jgi:signal transduction histidine kinase
VAAGAAPVATSGDYTVGQLVGLTLACVLYVLWNLVGTQGIVTLVLWEHADPPSLALRRPKCGPLLYFVIQLSLATLIYVTSDHGQIPSLMWLALLPPIAFSVFILEWRGILTVSTLVMAILILCFYRRHDWHAAGYAGLAFSFAVLFTIVFSMLAVQSEKARGEVQRLAAELGSSNRRLREYAVQAEELSATRERNRIAREVHDSLGHFLTVANVQLEAARVLWATDPARAQEAVLKAQSFTQEGLLDVRRSVASLRNSPLNNKSLSQALEELITAADSEKPAAQLTILGSARSLAPPVELSLYRAAQEGLTNAHRHANATSVQVVLDFQQKESVLLQVRDDGVGSPENLGQGGLGLRGLRERAQLLGGAVEIESTPNAGFTLKFQVPA